MTFTESQLAEFTAAYIEALQWSSIVTDANGECHSADRFELSTAGADKCRADCRTFCNDYRHLLEEVIDLYDIEQAGHDFALTRNGHGAGYWDRDDLSPVLADAITEAAKLQGEVYCYLNDQNEVDVE